MDQLLVALDVDTSERAQELADSLRDLAGGFKIGSRLFTSEGPALVRSLVDRGDRVFLDLKYHDIPTVVHSAFRAASALGVWMATVHTAGGFTMMQAAKEGAAAGGGHTLVVGVTVLTSFDQTTLKTIGVGLPIADQVDEALLRARAQGFAVQQAGRGFEIARAQRREGISSQLELTDAEVALRQSEFNYAQAVYDYLTARARLDEAVGQVPLVDRVDVAAVSQ